MQYINPRYNLISIMCSLSHMKCLELKDCDSDTGETVKSKDFLQRGEGRPLVTMAGWWWVGVIGRDARVVTRKAHFPTLDEASMQRSQ